VLLTAPVLFLVAAALLGFLIGWYFNRIQAIRAFNQLADESESRLRKMNAQLQLITEDNSELTDSLQQARNRLSSIEGGATLAARNARESDVQLKRRDRRIGELEAQTYAAEEQHMRVQRDFAKFRLYKTREVQQLQEQLLSRGEAVPTSDSRATPAIELPVLKKKAAAASVVAEEQLPDVTHEVLESDEDLMDMTSEFNFDPEVLLADD